MNLTVTTALFLAAFSLSANATPLFVKCVQNQLTSLGLEPGPVDGQVGPKTRKALAMFKGTDASFDDLPKLNTRYAVTWCRKLGALGMKTRRHMPSLESSVHLIDEAEGPFLNDRISESISGVKGYIAKRHKVILASRVDVVAGKNYKDIHKRLNKLKRSVGEHRGKLSHIKKKCHGFEGTQAFASISQITYCFPEDTVFDGDWSAKNHVFLAYVSAHEYFHHVQREFTADKEPKYIINGRRPKFLMRPSWLVEGSADVFAKTYIGEEFGIRNNEFTAFYNARKHKRTLVQISKNEFLESGEDYQVSELAAWILVKTHGMEAIFYYWENIGMGVEPEESFKLAFGMDQKQFNLIFESIRRDRRKFRAYLKAHS